MRINGAWRKKCAGALASLGLVWAGLDAQAQVSVQTIAGGPHISSCAPWAGFAGGNTFTNAQFHGPWASALDTRGNLWIADTTNSDVEEITDAGNQGASLTYQLYVQSYVTNKGKVTSVTNYHPFPHVNGVSVDAAGDLYVMTPTNGVLLKADMYLNGLSAISFTDGSVVPMATALLVDASSNVFMAFSNGMIVSFQLIDGYPPPAYTYDFIAGGNLAVKTIVTGFNWKPVAMALRTDGQLAVSDTLSNAIYLVATNANSTPRLLTGGNGVGWRDGTPHYAMFDQPHGIAASGDGSMIVCDTMNNRVRFIDTNLNTTTLYGTASNVWTATDCDSDPALFAGWVDGPAGTERTSASGREPVSVTISPSGNLFVTELFYDLIRTVSGATNLTPVGAGATNGVSTNAPAAVTFGPSYGYYPNCVTVSVTSAVPNVYYTTDGSTPTTNSDQVGMSFDLGLYVGTLQWCNPSEDLSSLRIAAFNGTNGSPVSAGTLAPTNLIGFPNSTYAGAGSTVYVPLVVDLESNVSLKSLQFSVEVTPNDTNTPSVSSLSLKAVTANDYLQLAGPSSGSATLSVTNFPSYTTPSNGVGLLFSAAGSGSGLDVQKFAAVVLLRVQLPKNAALGQSYSLNVLYPSGTSDGFEAEVGLEPMPAQNIVITDPMALAGGAAPATGYNDGEFGDAILNNSDANAVLYALVSVHRPYSDSDAFKAMDVYPETGSGTSGLIGDNLLTYLDWQTVVNRSLGRDTNTWIRCWTNGSLYHWEIPSVVPGTPVPMSDGIGGSPRKLDVGVAAPGLVWFCQFSIGAGTVTNAIPGNTYFLPVYANVLPGYNVSGMAFRATAVANGGAPAIGQIEFNTAADILAPQVSYPIAANDMLCSWDLGEIEPPLRGSNYLGAISFQVPPSAAPGESYTLQFVVGGGAPDLTTDYQMESFPGAVWVASAAQLPPSLTSDEWKTYFFGSTTNPLAADNADADGDGMPNWMEYRAGTNPTNSSSCFQFASAAFNNSGIQGVALNWLTAPGKKYVLESQSFLGPKTWTAINTNAGDGNYYQLLITNYSGNACFYQILLQP
ncbi:MAG TPA: chitobiase/beta-hexosaminidase C-terminal domain-containing protein [Verrucomicrobiae bacterium]|nr:chitobiase/beta-hexosaminidase C-terminal domain-containing protein [Verrucomicrobiae bacterium]